VTQLRKKIYQQPAPTKPYWAGGAGNISVNDKDAYPLPAVHA
jgi:hypothetical protein